MISLGEIMSVSFQQVLSDRTRQERIRQLTRFLDLTSRSGYVNVDPIIEELTALGGLQTRVKDQDLWVDEGL